MAVSSYVTQALLAAVDTIELRSRFGPPTTVRVVDLLAQKPGPPNPLLAYAKPTVILRGSIGEQVIAPYGRVGVDDWKLPTAIIVTVLGVGFFALLGAAYRLGGRR